MLLGGLYGKQQMRLAMALLFIVNAINLLLDIILVSGFGMTITALPTPRLQHNGVGLVLCSGGLRGRPGQPASYCAHSWGQTANLVDLPAFCQFFILGRDIFIRTILLLGCEALFLNEAANE